MAPKTTMSKRVHRTLRRGPSRRALFLATAPSPRSITLRRLHGCLERASFWEAKLTTTGGSDGSDGSVSDVVETASVTTTASMRGGEEEEEDDDDIPPGLQFLQGYPGTLVPIPLDDFGFAPENFPYFAHPYELNTQVPTEFTFWALAAHGQKGGFWVVDLPPNITRKEQIQPARYLRSSYGGSVLTFVAGGVRTSCMRHSDES